MNFGWKMRIGLVLSAVWLCVVFLIADDYRRVSQVLGLGLLPLVVLWGIAWAVQGWRAQRPSRPAPSESALLDAQQRRRNRTRTFFAVVAIVVIGIWAATWQFHLAGSEDAGRAINFWVGEWAVYAFIAYFVFRLVPRLPRGVPAVLAAIVLVGAVNYKAYAAITEERQARLSLAKAAPLINRMQAGALLSDKEVRDAHLGVLEPLMLAQAAFGREVGAIASTYRKNAEDLQVEQMLLPATLISPTKRASVKDRLKLWMQAADEYKTGIDAATARSKLGIQAALAQMPPAYVKTTTEGFESASAQVMGFAERHVGLEKEAANEISAILDLIDANASGVVFDRGPPPNLLFADETLLASYRQHFNAVLDLGKREAVNQAALSQYQTANTERLEGILKR